MAGTSDHDGPESVITMGRNTQTRGDGTTWKGYLGSTTSWDAAGRRTQGAVINPSGQTLFEEVIRYTIRDEVRAVIWSHGRTAPASEAQVYSFDELGRLMQFKQGAWDAAANSGQGDVNLATAPTTTNLSTTWKLDELSNWRSLDNDLDGSPAVGPTVHGESNFYEVFPTRFDNNADGTVDSLENLTMSRDAASGFIFKRDERVTGSTATQWLEYKHDLLGRLVEVKRYTSPTSFTVLAQYGYDSAGRLAWRCAGACGSGVPRKWLVYDGTQVVREGTGASSVAPDGSYVWLGSTLIKATGPTGVESYLHQDRLGSVVLQTHNNGTTFVTDGRAVYDPYGRPSTIPTWSTTALPLTVPYGYAGARRDDAVGLYLMGARWYDPTLGRFIEQDPIGEAGGMNLYAYTSSSPVGWTDPSGLARESSGNKLIDGFNKTAYSGCGARCQAASLSGYKQTDGRDFFRRARAYVAAQKIASEAGLSKAQTDAFVEWAVSQVTQGNTLAITQVDVQDPSSTEGGVAALSSNGDFWGEDERKVDVKSSKSAAEDQIDVTGKGQTATQNAIWNVRSLLSSVRFQLSLVLAINSLTPDDRVARSISAIVPSSVSRVSISVNQLTSNGATANALWDVETGTVWLSWKRLFNNSGDFLNVNEVAATIAHEFGHAISDATGWKPPRCRSCEEFVGMVWNSTIQDDNPDIAGQRFEGYIVESVFIHYWNAGLNGASQYRDWLYTPGASPSFFDGSNPGRKASGW